MIPRGLFVRPDDGGTMLATNVVVKGDMIDDFTPDNFAWQRDIGDWPSLGAFGGRTNGFRGS